MPTPTDEETTVPDAAEIAARACALAARRRDEWPDDEVVAELVGFSGGDPAALEAAWRGCARKDGDAVTRAAAALLHRAWARVNGFRETVLVPTRPGTPPRPVPEAAPAATVVAAPEEEATSTTVVVSRRGGLGGLLRRLLGRR